MSTVAASGVPPVNAGPVGAAEARRAAPAGVRRAAGAGRYAGGGEGGLRAGQVPRMQPFENTVVSDPAVRREWQAYESANLRMLADIELRGATPAAYQRAAKLRRRINAALRTLPATPTPTPQP